jgi:type I restriction enzyme S subunit
VLQIISGKNQKAVASVNGEYPIYGSGGIMGRSDEFLCEAGTTIVGRKGTINNPIFVNERFWNVDTAFGIAPGQELNPKFLYYFCCSYNFKALDKSTTIPSLAKRDLLNIEMPVPPLPEQERIVARIEELFSELDKAVETLNTIKQQLAVYRQAVLKEAFEGAFTIHHPVSVELDWSSNEETSMLPGIPSEWKYVSLSQLGDLGRGKSKHRPRNDPVLFENGKYPFIQTGDVKAAKHYITGYSKMYGEAGLQQSKLWPQGTLCITIAANIAETAFLGIPACFPDSVVGFVPFEYVLPEYVKHFIESQKLRLWAFAPATAQKNINLDTLEKLIVPYCSIGEQRQVVQEIEYRMSVCDSIEQTVDTALQQAEAMRQSILKQAFEGRL